MAGWRPPLPRPIMKASRRNTREREIINLCAIIIVINIVRTGAKTELIYGKKLRSLRPSMTLSECLAIGSFTLQCGGNKLIRICNLLRQNQKHLDEILPRGSPFLLRLTAACNQLEASFFFFHSVQITTKIISARCCWTTVKSVILRR